MALSTKDIINKLIHPELTRANDEPDYAILQLQEIFGKIYANAAEIPSKLGGGNHGHLGSVMTPTLYATISPKPCTDPADPGPNPVYPAGATATQRESIKDTWQWDTATYTTNNNVQTVMKAFIVKALPKACLAKKMHRLTGLQGVSAYNPMQHLMKRYRKIMEPIKQQAKKDFKEDYDPGQPIAIYFQRLDDGIQLANDAQIPYTPAQILQQASYQMKKSGLYQDECKAWKDKDPADRTWENFKTHFADAYFEKKEENQIQSSVFPRVKSGRGTTRAHGSGLGQLCKHSHSRCESNVKPHGGQQEPH